jgi:hypothetical protein
MTEKEKTEPKVLVVAQLPQQATREVTDGKLEYSCVTIEEALTEILEAVREIRKKI